MLKTQETSKRGGLRQRVAAQEVATTERFFEAKIPENAFSASKIEAISGHCDKKGSGKPEVLHRGAARKRRFF